MNKEDRLPHAVILAGPREKAEAEALKLAAARLCTSDGDRPCGRCRSCAKVASGSHPDLIWVEKLKDGKGGQKREIYVDQIREIVSTAPILPNDGDSKVYVIRDADDMNAAAQNALLKILEEPPEFVSFILLASSPGRLLETVRSRCASESLAGEDGDGDGEASERAGEYLALAESGDGFAVAKFCRDCESMEPRELRDFVRAVRTLTADTLSGRRRSRLPDTELMRLAELMERADRYLDFNVSVKHISGMIMALTISKRGI